MRAFVIATAFIFAPGAALAGMACTFPTECMSGEACTDSGYSVTVDTALAPGSLAMEGGFPTADTIVTDAETIPITWSGVGAALAATGRTGLAMHLLTVAPDGTALYSVHLPAAEIAITYLGSCKGT
ncbi:MAG: hypothetical protein AAGM21_01730 [Pseudomonadota bacterium]